MTGQVVRFMSGHVRGRTGRTTTPLKGLSVRRPVSGKQNSKSRRQRARDEKLEQVRTVRAALKAMLKGPR
jgi:ribosomal protein L6P/L9E